MFDYKLKVPTAQQSRTVMFSSTPGLLGHCPVCGERTVNRPTIACFSCRVEVHTTCAVGIWMPVNRMGSAYRVVCRSCLITD